MIRGYQIVYPEGENADKAPTKFKLIALDYLKELAWNKEAIKDITSDNKTKKEKDIERNQLFEPLRHMHEYNQSSK